MDEQVIKLKGLLPKFRKAKASNQLCIIQDAVEELEKTWKHQVAFSQEVVETVHACLAVFFPSHT